MEIKEEGVVLERKKIDRSQFEEAAYILKALANETRLCVIMQLTQSGEKSVTELMEDMDCEQSLLSHHLTDMRAKGILRCRKSGKNSFYSLRDNRFSNVLKCILDCGS
ncbi:MAG: metalloregulator ArsR/SmtB family transcription factor [Proteiniphilum sp.]|jgi:ArsR family transcriptional regulator|uniref:ArsR/SmtB family transcription factor n=1 Tax=Proteiniphilum sp. TaxID=1926877 RepID=UPI00092CDF16|nr:metalloregulator ArsR/SmtB family transcription factor [Proteiniphilum sp.]MEA5128101.1 metalloregulator ArsR/SmtB family transcription factor [Proteiniphilum sp.]OJV85914.1 MAG: transcriptional regulator [Bacteroidia bacterium 44-10]